MKKQKTLALTRDEVELALRGVGELPYSDGGVDFCLKLEAFLGE